MAKEEQANRMNTPEGRLINSSLWEKDTYKDAKGREATPSYKMEMTFDWDDVTEMEDAIVQVAIEEWGEAAEDDYEKGNIRSPILDGDDLAEKREKKGKKGEAYAGLAVMRASTIFNSNGEDAPGGTYVADENGDEIDFANRKKIYNGCRGIANVTFSAYSIDGKRGVTAYLNGFQFAEDGERLRGDAVAAAFKPLNKTDESTGRKARGRGKGK